MSLRTADLTDDLTLAVEHINNGTKLIMIKPEDAFVYFHKGISILCNYDARLIQNDKTILKAHHNAQLAIDMTILENEAKIPVKEKTSATVAEEFTKLRTFIKIALEVKLQNATLFNLKGFMHFALKEYEYSLQCYDKAISLDSNTAGYYHNRGCCYLSKKLIDKAEDDFKKALTLDHHFEFSIKQLATIKKLKSVAPLVEHEKKPSKKRKKKIKKNLTPPKLPENPPVKKNIIKILYENDRNKLNILSSLTKKAKSSLEKAEKIMLTLEGEKNSIYKQIEVAKTNANKACAAANECIDYIKENTVDSYFKDYEIAKSMSDDLKLNIPTKSRGTSNRIHSQLETISTKIETIKIQNKSLLSDIEIAFKCIKDIQETHLISDYLEIKKKRIATLQAVGLNDTVIEFLLQISKKGVHFTGGLAAFFGLLCYNTLQNASRLRFGLHCYNTSGNASRFRSVDIDGLVLDKDPLNLAQSLTVDHKLYIKTTDPNYIQLTRMVTNIPMDITVGNEKTYQGGELITGFISGHVYLLSLSDASSDTAKQKFDIIEISNGLCFGIDKTHKHFADFKYACETLEYWLTPYNRNVHTKYFAIALKNYEKIQHIKEGSSDIKMEPKLYADNNKALISYPMLLADLNSHFFQEMSTCDTSRKIKCYLEMFALLKYAGIDNTNAKPYIRALIRAVILTNYKEFTDNPQRLESWLNRKTGYVLSILRKTHEQSPFLANTLMMRSQFEATIKKVMAPTYGSLFAKKLHSRSTMTWVSKKSQSKK